MELNARQDAMKRDVEMAKVDTALLWINGGRCYATEGTNAITSAFLSGICEAKAIKGYMDLSLFGKSGSSPLTF